MLRRREKNNIDTTCTRFARIWICQSHTKWLPRTRRISIRNTSVNSTTPNKRRKKKATWSGRMLYILVSFSAASWVMPHAFKKKKKQKKLLGNIIFSGISYYYYFHVTHATYAQHTPYAELNSSKSRWETSRIFRSLEYNRTVRLFFFFLFFFDDHSSLLRLLSIANSRSRMPERKKRKRKEKKKSVFIRCQCFCRSSFVSNPFSKVKNKTHLLTHTGMQTYLPAQWCLTCMHKNWIQINNRAAEYIWQS